MFFFTSRPTDGAVWPTSAVTGGGGNSSFPPVKEKLIVYAKGDIVSGVDVDQNPDTDQDPDVSYEYYRRDIMTGYHLYVDPHGDAITNQWDTANATYLAWHDILLIDPAPLIAADALGTGPFFFDASGNPVPRTMAEMINHANTSDIFFFCRRKGKYELRHYNEVLTGQELVDANAWCA